MSVQQKQELVSHIKENDQISFVIHAKWATEYFGVYISPAECLMTFLAALD